MKFIIKVCDDLGFELSRHEVYAEPNFSPVDDMVYFEFKPHYLAVTKDIFDTMPAIKFDEIYEDDEE